MEITVRELKLSFPEGLRVLSKEERAGMKMIKDGEGEVLSDPNRHILVSIAYKKTGLFTGMVDTKDAVVSMERQTASPMKDYGYVREGFETLDVGGKKADAFSYHYEAQGVAMSGESAILRHENTFYYIHVYYRTALKEESSSLVKGVLSKAEWSK